MATPKQTEAEKVTNLLDTLSAMKYVGERLQHLGTISDDSRMLEANYTLRVVARRIVEDLIDAMPEEHFPASMSSHAMAELDDNVKGFSSTITEHIVDRVAKAEVPRITP